MTWDEARRQWGVVGMRARRRWAKLSEADLRQVAGDRQRLVAKLRERYGIGQATAELAADSLVSGLQAARRGCPP